MAKKKYFFGDDFLILVIEKIKFGDKSFGDKKKFFGDRTIFFGDWKYIPPKESYDRSIESKTSKINDLYFSNNYFL